MPSINHPQATEEYLFSRNVFRSQAQKEFYEGKHGVTGLVFAINDYVATTTLELSGQTIQPIQNGPYILGLMVSFVRTHFIIIDLVACSELIDAVTLLRKQFELLARLNELNIFGSSSHMLKKTPNLSVLKTNVSKLYDEYSGIAHSAHPESLQLLGRIKHGESEATSVYPVFHKNAYVTLQHVALSVFEYHIFAHQFLSKNYQNYDSNWGGSWLIDATEKYVVFCNEL